MSDNVVVNYCNIQGCRFHRRGNLCALDMFKCKDSTKLFNDLPPNICSAKQQIAEYKLKQLINKDNDDDENQ